MIYNVYDASRCRIALDRRGLVIDVILSAFIIMITLIYGCISLGKIIKYYEGL